MKRHKNFRISHAEANNLAGCKFGFAGGSIVLDDIGEKPSCLSNGMRFFGHRLLPILSLSSVSAPIGIVKAIA
jgi:hypothetical protein